MKREMLELSHKRIAGLVVVVDRTGDDDCVGHFWGVIGNFVP